MEVTCHRKTYHAFRMFTIGFPIFMVLVAGILWIGRSIASFPFVVLGWVGLCSGLFIFQGRIRKIFTRNVTLTFDDQTFTIAEYDANHSIVRESVADWKSIAGYKVYTSASETTYLTLYMGHGRRKNYSFVGQDGTDELKIDGIIGTFCAFVKEQNRERLPQEQIELRPGFLLTPVGSLMLYGVMLLAICDAILLYRTQAKTSLGFLVAGACMIIGLWGKRRSDRIVYEELNKL